MSNVGNGLGAVINGTFSAIYGFAGMKYLLDSANIRAVVVHNKLADAPEITDQLYRTAKEAANRISSGDLATGLFFTAMAGVTGGLALYYAGRREEN